MIKSFLKNILFKGKQPKTFPAVRIPDGKVNEIVLLRNTLSELEITQDHCVVCHRPFLMAVWLDRNEAKWELIVVGDKVKRSSASLSAYKKIEIENRTLTIFSIDKPRNFQIGYFRQRLLHRYFKYKDTLLEGKIYAALYSYPRQVIIVSFKEDDYFNIFPMDFQCMSSEKQLIVLGLRTTNSTIERIIRTGKVAISDSGSLSLETVYQLGRNHSAAPPSIKELPFGIIESEFYHFPLPEGCAYYYEIEIIKFDKLGSHMLLLGKVINTKQLRDRQSSIYHIQFFQSFKSNYKQA